MIARPTAASAAATAIVNTTNDCPLIELFSQPKATSVMLAAVTISSTHMKMMIMLRRIRTPIIPMMKSTALRSRK